jgi:SAM-dependent methyltransferase
MPYCVICEKQVERWLPYPYRNQLGQFTRLLGSVGSDLERHNCPNCHCNDRERHLLLYLQAEGIYDNLSGLRILHMAPESNLELRIQSARPKEYIRGDLAPTRPEHRQLNVEKLPFKDGSFNLILCNHVLEHVADPDRAMAELARCLAPSGQLIAQTPYVPNMKWTFEMFEPVSTSFAKLFYGQEDHVRLFGADLLHRFHAAGLDGELLPHHQVLAEFDCDEYGCNEREPFFLFAKRP